jgi:XapX domain-containing protein
VGNIKQISLSMLTGMVVGFLFAKLSLPIPAPPTIEAFMGILGVWLGAGIIDIVMGNLSREEG